MTPEKQDVPTDRGPAHYLRVAKRHLDKVLDAWSEPTDWADLATFGLYCLEALIRAASLVAGKGVVRTHWGKAEVADALHKEHGLTDVATLMADLNRARKANAYGDQEFNESDFNAEQIAIQIESFFDEVTFFVDARGRTEG